MSAPIKCSETKFNVGLGFKPVSLFIDFFEDEKVSEIDLYDTIRETEGVTDVIFRENVEVNTDALFWVSPRLISEGYFVSVFSNDLPQFAYNRLISVIPHPNEIRKNLKTLTALTKNDILVANVDTVDFLIFTRKLILNQNIQAKVMFNINKLHEEDLLSKGVYDIFPTYL